jgi:hypothetical protein
MPGFQGPHGCGSPGMARRQLICRDRTASRCRHHQGHRPPGQQQLGQVQVRPAEVAGEHEQADQDQQDGGNEVESHRVGVGEDWAGYPSRSFQ